MQSQKTTTEKNRTKDILVVALISLCLGIPAAEIALRVTCAYCTWTEKNGEGFVSPYADRESSWYHVREPNSVTRFDLPKFTYELKTNSLGLRDIEHPLAKSPDQFRLVVDKLMAYQPVGPKTTISQSRVTSTSLRQLESVGSEQ